MFSEFFRLFTSISNGNTQHGVHLWNANELVESCRALILNDESYLSIDDPDATKLLFIGSRVRGFLRRLHDAKKFLFSNRFIYTDTANYDVWFADEFNRYNAEWLNMTFVSFDKILLLGNRNIDSYELFNDPLTGIRVVEIRTSKKELFEHRKNG